LSSLCPLKTILLYTFDQGNHNRTKIFDELAIEGGQPINHSRTKNFDELAIEGGQPKKAMNLHDSIWDGQIMIGSNLDSLTWILSLEKNIF